MNERLEKSLVRDSATIEDAMRSLEVSETQVVLVVDADGRLVGTLTDGDLRRALLGGATLSSRLEPFAHRECITVEDAASRAEVLDVMKARQILHVPVIDSDRRVVGLHLLHELLGARERPNWAVVMAGGKGTRLGSLTKTLPKPMIQVAGRPILERIVLHLVGCGYRHVFLSVGYMSEVIEEHFGDGHGFGCRIEYLREDQPLDTAGALSLLPSRPEHPVLVTNGDLVTQTDFAALMDFHQRGDQSVTLAVRQYSYRIPYGCVDVSKGQLLGFREKPLHTHLINAGIYALDPEIVEMVPKNQPMAAPELISRAADAGHKVKVLEIGDDWIDIGERDQLDRARGKQ